MPDMLKIYQANLRKQCETHHSIMNDKYLSDFGLILISEPNSGRTSEGKVIADPSYHRQWLQYVPTKLNEEGSYPIRSLIWVNQNLKTKQVPIPSSDLTAVEINIGERVILAVSVYVPPKSPGDTLQHLMTLIRIAINSVSAQVMQATGKEVELIIAGDFNRHNPLWGGSRADQSRYQGEADAIIDLMAEFGLQSLLPRGTITFESSNGASSTIDLTLASPRLVEDKISCIISSTEHGSDHQAIETMFDITIEDQIFAHRKLWREAPWNEIAHEIRSVLNHSVPPDPSDVSQYAEWLENLIKQVTESLVPAAKKSSYAKRWWTSDLSTLRRRYTWSRNAARVSRRRSQRDASLENAAKQAKKEYFDAIRQQKKKDSLARIFRRLR